MENRMGGLQELGGASAPFHARVVAGALTHCDPGWTWDASPNARPLLNIWLVLAGSGSIELAGVRYEAGVGDCFLIRRYEETHGRHDPKHPLSVLWIDFDFCRTTHKTQKVQTTVGLDELRALELPPIYRRIADTGFLESLMRRALEPPASGQVPGGAFWMDACLLEMLRIDQRDSRDVRTGSHAAALAALCRAMSEYPGRGWRVGEMADGLHLTRDHFSRLFLQFAGVRPAEYLLSRRIERARSLLSMSNHRVGEIAEALGFHDVYHFSACFRSRVGMPPTAYRRRFSGE